MPKVPESIMGLLELVEDPNNKVMTKVTISKSKKIEDYLGPDSLLADFANAYIGGGAAEFGNV